MSEKLEKFLSWKVVAYAVCVILLAMATSVYSERGNHIQLMDQKLEQKLDIKRYESDIQRLEKKIDILITMHLQDGGKTK